MYILVQTAWVNNIINNNYYCVYYLLLFSDLVYSTYFSCILHALILFVYFQAFFVYCVRDHLVTYYFRCFVLILIICINSVHLSILIRVIYLIRCCLTWQNKIYNTCASAFSIFIKNLRRTKRNCRNQCETETRSDKLLLSFFIVSRWCTYHRHDKIALSLYYPINIPASDWNDNKTRIVDADSMCLCFR